MLRSVARYRGALIAGGLLLPLALAGLLLMGIALPIALGVIVLAALATVAIHGAWMRRAAPPAGEPRSRRLLASGLLAIAAVGLLIQLVPYGRDHGNPPITAEPSWDSPRTRELVVKACFDCHSNEVKWPWYSNVAPLSWAVFSHVQSGRRELNYSEWDRRHEEGSESAEKVREGTMPPAYYVLTHPAARLTRQEEAALIRGLEATFGRSDAGRGEDGEHDDDWRIVGTIPR